MAAVVCSWSGGKDSMLALQLAVDAGYEPKTLLTMLDESGDRTRSHGLPLSLVVAQAEALGLPLLTRRATWTDYEEAFIDGLGQCAANGCATCVFGDIDIDDHRAWCERVSSQARIQSLHPLWQRDRRAVVEGFLERGYEAVIVVVRDSALDRSFLGRRLDHELINDLEGAGVDICGENGEFHTLVVDGPLFASPLQLRQLGILSVADCSLMDYTPETSVRTP
jgi:diphthine-ammonia ligase